MIKLYGFLYSRASRAMWMLSELGLEYEMEQITPYGEEIHQEAYLKINPNGHVPALKDGDTVIWESMAINLYLAHKYGGDLQPANPEEWGQTYNWGFWGMTEAEALLLQALNHTRLLPEEKRDPAKHAEAAEKLKKPMGILNNALAGKDYLLGSRFTVADLNLAAIFSWGKMSKVDFSACPHLDGWLGRCLDRPKYKALYAK